MYAWEQIQKTVDYIEDHLSEEIEAEMLAKTAALSQFYYQRLFSRLVKRPVQEYIKLRRLAKASEALLQSGRRILDIALDCGFSSHETFTRAFKVAFGLTPEEYRANPVRLNNFVKPQLLLNYVLVDEGVPLITDGIVLEITRKRLATAQRFIGLTAQEPIAQMPGGGETGVDSLGALWDSFHKMKPSLPVKPDGDEIGITFEGTKSGYYRYFAGAETLEAASVQGCDCRELGAGEYIVCTFEAEDFEHLVMDAVYKAHRYLYETWLPNHGLTGKPFAAERYASHDAATTAMEIWIMPEPKAL
ncbi:AraC family transcriptional regulator [Acetanaerobacterium elongatum]|uniref:Transcriptional regulator, AraC family n=1 Tax=Acetanaerobacterium elongatum TaxID=258515 RepID=A0A1G9U610_9FIRM|nr:AraC family transcriptional regulator [Acetanaerobacterium elongatum]SDM54995.1 transcriptional regulator, AraC family [Acetanaerobacterium elongatum]